MSHAHTTGRDGAGGAASAAHTQLELESAPVPAAATPAAQLESAPARAAAAGASASPEGDDFQPIEYKGSPFGTTHSGPGAPKPRFKPWVKGECGNPAARWKPGHSGNPAGSSWKQRCKMEVQGAIKPGDIRHLVERAMDGGDPIQLLKLLAPIIGLVEQDEKRAITIDLQLRDRRDGSRPTIERAVQAQVTDGRGKELKP